MTPSLPQSTRSAALTLVALCATTLAGAQSRVVKPTSVQSTVTGSTTAVARVALTDGLVPEIARSKKLAVVSPSTVISFTVALKPGDLAGLQAFADAVSDPKSKSYRQFITPEEVGSRFGAAAFDRQAVADYLASKGLTVTLIAPSGLSIMAEGTATNIQNAFGTTLSTYQGPDAEGKTITFRANETALTVPATLANVVTYVSGIETYTRPQRRTPTATLTPQLISSAYGLTATQNAGYLGAGRHVAFSNFDGLRVANASTYVQYFGLPYPSGGVTSNVSIVTVGTSSASGSPSGEGDLDLQMEIGQAPLADIRIYDGTDLLSVLTREATDNWADVTSESYGWSAGGTTAQKTATWNSWHNQHLAMTAQGMTYMAASGDSSTHLSPYAYPDFDPEVLMVGGSVTTVDDTTGARVSESGWSYSGGGWYNTPANSITWNVLPSWQKGTGVPTTINRRLAPDISSQSAANNSSSYSPGGVYVVYTPTTGTYANQQGLYSFDGTSCASPIVAGQIATLEGRLYASNTDSTRPRLGRVQDLIYAQNASGILGSVYNDITSGTGLYQLLTSSADGGSNSSYAGGAQAATTGWDFLTGFGTINMEGFYQSLLPSASISLTLGNYAGDVTQVPVVVQFRTPGTTTVVSTQTVTPTANGTLSLKAPGVGTYDVSIKASHWLRRTMTNVAFTAAGSTSMTASLVNGDVNGDNVVSAADRSIITVALGTAVGGSGYNANADLNGDGVVSAADRAIATANLGQVGDN